jgi:hypothetical protein
MGECGCGELNTREGYELGGLILVVEIYLGCLGCGTEAQVAVHLFTPEEAKDYDIEIKGRLAPGEQGWGRLVFPLLGADDLIAAAKLLGEEGDGFGDVAEIADILPSKLTRLLQEGFASRRRKVDWSNKPAPAGNE